MAMRRTIADLVTNFRVAGLDRVRTQFDRMTQGVRNALKKLQDSRAGQALKKGFDTAAKAGQAIKTRMDAVGKSITAVTAKVRDQAKAFAQSAAASAKVGAGKLAGGLAAGAMGAAAAIGVGAAGAVAASSAIKEEVLEANKLARSLGLSLEHMSGLGKIGRSVGIEIGDMAGMMQQFKDAAAQAASGEAFTDTFKGIKLKGVAATDQLNAFAKKWAGIRSQGGKDAFLSDVFGAENLARASELMAKIARSRAGLTSDLKAMVKSGSGFTQADLQRATKFRNAINGWGEAVRRFQLMLARAFGKPITNMLRIVTALFLRFQPQIVEGMVRTWNKFIRVFVELFSVLSGIEKIGKLNILDLVGGGGVQNTWIFKLRDTLAEVWKVTKIAAQGFADFVRWIVAASPAIQEFGRRTISILRDVFSMLNGGGPSAENEFLIDWKRNVLTTFKAAKAWAADAMAYIGGIVSSGIATVTDAMSALKAVFNDVITGLTTGDTEQTTTIFGTIAAQARAAADWVVHLGTTIFNMLAFGDRAGGEFAWLNTLYDGITRIVDIVGTAYSAFETLLAPINELLKLFGTDLAKALLFVGILRFTGILGGVVKVLGLFGTPLRIVLAGLGSIATAVGASGGIAAGLALLGTKVMAFIGAAGPWGLLIAAGAGLGVALANALEGSIIDDWFQRWTDGIHRVAEAMSDAKRSSEASLDRYGDKMGGASGSRGPNRAAAAINRAAAPIRTQGSLDYITAGARPSGRTVNWNIDIGGTTVNATAPEDQVDAAMRARSRSMTGGRS